MYDRPMILNPSNQLAARLQMSLGALAADGKLAFASLLCAKGSLVEAHGLLPESFRRRDASTVDSTVHFMQSSLGDRLRCESGEGLLQTARHHSFYLLPIAEDFMLFAAGNRTVDAGLVRIASRLHAPALERLLEEIKTSSPAEDPNPETTVLHLSWCDLEKICAGDFPLLKNYALTNVPEPPQTPQTLPFSSRPRLLSLVNLVNRPARPVPPMPVFSPHTLWGNPKQGNCRLSINKKTCTEEPAQVFK